MAVSGKGMKKGAESLLEHVGRNKPYLKKNFWFYDQNTTLDMSDYKIVEKVHWDILIH